LDEFVNEIDEDIDEIDSNSNGDESGLVQSAMRELNELSNR
jgi:hypothetical protein